jgi:hypothetical protein
MVTKRDPAGVPSGDLLPWERQEGETDAAFAAFKAWLDSDKRQLKDFLSTARNWSARYHWSVRAHEYDIYLSRTDLEEQVRYRRKMNERHRRMAAVAQSKLVAWLNELDDANVARMTVADATRLWDVAVRIEQAATSAVSAAEDLPDPYSEPPRENGLQQRLRDAGLDVDMSELARLLHERLGPPPEPPRFPLPRRQAQADAAPRQAQDDAAPLGPQPGEETPQDTIWGERWQPGVDQYGGPR